MESLSASSGGGGNGGGGGVIRTGGTWVETDRPVSGDSGESGLGSLPALESLLGYVQLRDGLKRSMQDLSLLCLPAHPCWVPGFPNNLHPPISSPLEQPYFRARGQVSHAHLSQPHTDGSMSTCRHTCLPVTETHLIPETHLSPSWHGPEDDLG